MRFALEEKTAFGRLVSALHEALPAMIEHSAFAQGAYEFWRRAYARELSMDDAPRSWRPFIREGGREALYQFMFSLETAYALISRIMLAKAMQDAGFRYLNILETFEQSLDARDVRGALDCRDYLHATKALLEEGARQAFSGLFRSDIFDWWEEGAQVPDPSPLCDAIAEAAIGIFQFDFSRISGDILGTLYQSYFDPETRKALGEFYTPPEVASFILDQVGYRGRTIRTARLLDPACGSGTFLIHAIRRFIEASRGRDPREVLDEMVGGLRIVGFDINPFACLMAQMNYAAQMLPLYVEALRIDPGFSIPGLPVIRTDSLRKEMEEREADEEGPTLSLRFEYVGDVAKISTELPVRAREGFLKVRVPVPTYDRAKERGLVDNVEEYFQYLAALFSAIRDDQVSVNSLTQRLSQARMRRPRELAEFSDTAVQEIRETLIQLRQEYADGRFLKTFEEVALSLVLKNELKYDFVVGNPPYVRIQTIPESFRRRWERRYDWARGNFDIFIPFIQRAVNDWLRENAKLGYICSNRFLLANYAQNLREGLPSVATIDLLFDLRDTRVFKDALNYPAILILNKVQPPPTYDFPVARVFADPGEGPQKLLEEASGLLTSLSSGRSSALAGHVDAFKERSQALRPEGWYLMPPKERRVFQALEEAATQALEELTLTRSGGFQGYVTGKDEVLVVQELENRGERLLVRPKGGGEPVEIERAVLRPFLFGRDVQRWYIDWKGWYVFFPYMQVEGHYRLIPCRNNMAYFDYSARLPLMDEVFPMAWRYFTNTKNERELREREGGRYRIGKPEAHLWYGAARPQNLALYERPKLVLQMSSTTADISFDNVGYVFQAGGRGGGVYGIDVDGSLVDEYVLLGLLNSTPLDFYLKHVSTVYQGHAYSYSDQFIKGIPIKLPRNRREKEKAQRVSNLSRHLIETKGQLRGREKELETFPNPQLLTLSGEEIYPLRRLVAGEPERARLHLEGAQVVERLGKWFLRLGRDSIGFPSGEHALLTLRWLQLQGRDEVETESLLSLRLPVSASACQTLLDALDHLNEEIDRLKRALSHGEGELDDLVANLYGLTPTHLKTVQEFLERF